MGEQMDRWELAAPFDALSWALCLKNRRAARALLEKRETLTWIEGSEYAPLTLGWAPELLDMILDRVPEGETALHPLTMRRPDVQWVLSVPGLELVLDRNAIPSQVDMDVLLFWLDHARMVGDVPEGELSSLAARLLNDIMERSSKSGIVGGRPDPVSDRYRSILLEQDPGLIWRYLDEKGRGKDPAVLVALTLLGIKVGGAYDL